MSWAEIKKAINSDLNKPLNEGGVKIVKSVQRGTSSIPASITISSVNPSKSIVIVQGGSYSSNYSGAAYGTMDTSGTGITLSTSSSEKGRCSWQVIEFY